MNEKEFKKEWFDIINSNLIVIKHYESFITIPLPSEEVYLMIENIFSLIRKAKNDRFYNNKDIERIYSLVYNDIETIHEILDVVDVGATVLIYSIILDIFDGLVKLTESEEMYESSANLLKFRDYWFGDKHIKIIPITNVKQK